MRVSLFSWIYHLCRFTLGDGLHKLPKLNQNRFQQSRKSPFCFGGGPFKGPLFFEDKKFIFTVHSHTIGTLLNAEYECNMSNVSRASEGHVHAYRRDFRNHFLLRQWLKMRKSVKIARLVLFYCHSTSSYVLYIYERANIWILLRSVTFTQALFHVMYI